MKRLLILADDLTGSVDTGAFPVARGKEVTVYTDVNSYEDDSKELVCINMGTRSKSPDEAYRIHENFARTLLKYEGCLFKKLDMGFRGNPAVELEGLMRGCGRSVGFIVPALPQFLTFTLYGKQFVKGRILEESLYAKDPIHPAKESDVVNIFQKGTALKVGSVDIDAVKSDRLLCRVREMLAESVQFIIFDAVSDQDCMKIFELLYPVYPDAVWAGTLGLLGGITDVFYGPGKQQVIPERERRCACFSGTTYDVTRRQIEYCQERGMCVIPLNIRKCLREDSRMEELERVVKMCRSASEENDFCVLPDAQGLKGDELPKQILEILTDCAEMVLRQVPADRVVIIGGETSNAVFHQLKVQRLLIREKPETGVAAGIFLDGICAGMEFAAKGGSVGTLAALQRMIGKE